MLENKSIKVIFKKDSKILNETSKPSPNNCALKIFTNQSISFDNSN